VNSHTNARLTLEGRKLLIGRVASIGLRAAAEAAGVSLRTARKWLKRYEEHGVEGLTDRSSRSSKTRSTVDEGLDRSIEQLRGLRMPMRRIGELVGRSVSTVSRWLARLGLSRLKALEPVRPILR
jgi:transposase